MAEEELQQLIEGCKRQDRQSQKALYLKLYGFAMKICLRCANNRYEASEVLNEGFFKAFTNIDKYDSHRPFKTWLGKIMYNACIDYYRANIKWAKMEALEKADSHLNAVVVDNELEYEDLLAYVQRLPPAYRIVFNLYAIDGYSHDEIGQMMGISAGTSRSNLYKARLRLQKMLNGSHTINYATDMEI